MVKTLEEVIDLYLKRGFGTMTKKDFELYIFHYLMENEFKDKSIYQISVKLKIPTSRVKTLQYEASLRYSKDYEAENYAAVCKLLEKAKFKKNEDMIQFSIEEIALRRYLDAVLKTDGRFSDTSFNSEIVSLSYDDLKFFFSTDVSTKLLIDNVLQRARKVYKKDDFSFHDLLDKYKEATAKELIDSAAKSTINIGIKAIGTYLKLI